MSSTVLSECAPSTQDDLACAAFAYGSNRAEAYCRILREAGITVVLGEEMGSPNASHESGRAIPVLVPFTCHERAGELLAAFDVANSDWSDSDDDFDDDDDDDIADDDDDDEFYDDDDYDDDDDDDDDFDDLDDE